MLAKCIRYGFAVFRRCRRLLGSEAEPGHGSEVSRAENPKAFKGRSTSTWVATNLC